MRQVSIEMSFKLPVKLTKRKKWYVADCPALNVASQGETEKQAKKNLIEALTAFFHTCLERGTLDAVMQECGFKSVNVKQDKKADKSEYVRIPIHLLANESCGNRCHA